MAHDNNLLTNPIGIWKLMFVMSFASIDLRHPTEEVLVRLLPQIALA